MRDTHCHILPGVDDGARDLAESLRMAEAARQVGVTSIVCTPHCRDPYFSYDAMWQAFFELRDALAQTWSSCALTMGFEVQVAKLRQLGSAWAPVLGCGMTEPASPDGSGEGREFLLELETGATARDFAQDYERAIFELQGMGYAVVIAHPERYRAIQADLALAERLVSLGCVLQCSASFLGLGPLNPVRRTARRLMRAGLCDRVASDAHRPEDYALLGRLRG